LFKKGKLASAIPLTSFGLWTTGALNFSQERFTKAKPSRPAPAIPLLLPTDLIRAGKKKIKKGKKEKEKKRQKIGKGQSCHLP
jgi:hypothetical protein